MAEYTDEQWAEARRLVEAGSSLRAATAGSGVPLSTLRRRAEREGWESHGQPAVSATPEQRRAQTAAANEVSRRVTEERRAALAVKLLDLAEYHAMSSVAPHVYKEAKVVPGPAGTGSDVEIVEIPVEAPNAADRKALVTAAAILVDKVQLLTGEATSRSEVSQLPREALEAKTRHVRDQLAERRAAAEASEVENTATGG